MIKTQQIMRTSKKSIIDDLSYRYRLHAYGCVFVSRSSKRLISYSKEECEWPLIKIYQTWDLTRWISIKNILLWIIKWKSLIYYSTKFISFSDIIKCYRNNCMSSYRFDLSYRYKFYSKSNLKKFVILQYVIYHC